MKHNDGSGPTRNDTIEVPRPEWFAAFLADCGTPKPAARYPESPTAALITRGDTGNVSRMSGNTSPSTERRDISASLVLRIIADLMCWPVPPGLRGTRGLATI
jgi:hypothetical protein